MKISVIGAPGSGKTFLSGKIADLLHLEHIECDKIYWSEADLRTEVEKRIQNDNWILEGHMTKLQDLVIPKSDKFIVIESSNVLSLVRAVKRDLINFNKAWYNIQFYAKMANKRNELIQSIRSTRPDDILYLDNFSYLSESDLAAFCERVKSSSLKTQKPAIKSKSSGKVKEAESDSERP